ncbi:MAG: hypothetical protein FWG64_12200 [Firmicutes bacterium]|nr:hypothetical protein [Bacillota bacterium]
MDITSSSGIYYNFFQDIRKNPDKYLKKSTLNHLSSCIMGYQFCFGYCIFPLGYNINGLHKGKIAFSLFGPHNFVEFVTKKFHDKLQGQNVMTKDIFGILELIFSETDAFVQYFELMDEYLAILENTLPDGKPPAKRRKAAPYEKLEEAFDNLYCEMMSSMKIHYNFYIMENSLEHFEDFLNGYHACLTLHGVPLALYSKFNAYVADKYNAGYKSTVCDIIYSLGNDSQKSLEMVFEMFEEFVEIEFAM